MASDLLQEALKRSALQSASPSRGRKPNSPQFSTLSLSDSIEAFSISAQNPSNAEDELISVFTPLPSPSPSTASSRSSSRNTSPTRKGKGAGKPRRDKTKEIRNLSDPLVRFDNQINSRIFAQLDSTELVICSIISKKWRNSQTINFTWFKLLESLTYTTTPIILSPTEKDLLWTRRDSKINWRERFASLYAVAEVVEGADEINEEGMTMKEEREERWRIENDELEANANDKGLMREHYKNLGNSKVKGKSGKGGETTWGVEYND